MQSLQHRDHAWHDGRRRVDPDRSHAVRTHIDLVRADCELDRHGDDDVLQVLVVRCITAREAGSMAETGQLSKLNKMYSAGEEQGRRKVDLPATFQIRRVVPDLLLVHQRHEIDR